jgi:endogenous inhibitor of DNA gyrase (YacG/DUF329 family)
MLRCPICRKPVDVTEVEAPFCSRRCRVIDLGNWASEKYVIHTPVQNPEAFGKAEEDWPPEEGEKDSAEGQRNRDEESAG